MLNTVHVAAAAAIVATTPNPALSLPLALASHIALDAVPHWNWSPGRTRRGKVASLGDGVLAIGLTGWLMTVVEPGWVVVIACALSMLPDVIQAPYHFWGWRPGWLVSFIAWERKRQKWPWMKPWMGIATQVAVFMLSMLVVLG